MSNRPQTTLERIGRLLSDSKLSELMRETSKERWSLDDDIETVIDIRKTDTGEEQDRQ